MKTNKHRSKSSCRIF